MSQRNIWITGDKFGIESGLPAIIECCIVILLAVLSKHKIKK